MMTRSLSRFCLNHQFKVTKSSEQRSVSYILLKESVYKMSAKVIESMNPLVYHQVELLLRVHHKNLTALIGYCNEGKKMALIYEFMANGTLGDYLSGQSLFYLVFITNLLLL